MRSLMKAAIVLLICLVGIGLSRGWFSLSNANSDPESNTASVNVSLDKDKMKSDVKMAKEKVKDEIKQLEAKAKANDKK